MAQLWRCMSPIKYTATLLTCTRLLICLDQNWELTSRFNRNGSFQYNLDEHINYLWDRCTKITNTMVAIAQLLINLLVCREFTTLDPEEEKDSWILHSYSIRGKCRKIITCQALTTSLCSSWERMKNSKSCDFTSADVRNWIKILMIMEIKHRMVIRIKLRELLPSTLEYTMQFYQIREVILKIWTNKMIQWSSPSQQTRPLSALSSFTPSKSFTVTCACIPTRSHTFAQLSAAASVTTKRET